MAEKIKDEIEKNTASNLLWMCFYILQKSKRNLETKEKTEIVEYNLDIYAKTLDKIKKLIQNNS